MKEKSIRLRVSEDKYRIYKEAANKHMGGNLSELIRRELDRYVEQHQQHDIYTDYEYQITKLLTTQQ